MQGIDDNQVEQTQIKEKGDYFARLSVNRRIERIKDKVGITRSFFLGNLFNKIKTGS